jgi:hypothetical protein
MDAASLTTLITGPAVALALSLWAVRTLWMKMEKMIDSLQVLVADNTKAMQAMQMSSDRTTHALEVLTSEVRLLNGKTEVSGAHPIPRLIP